MDDRKPARRMKGPERREQLIAVARSLFAERGYDGAAIEEIAARAGVSKPVVYEHFGGKEGLYAVVVDREVTLLLGVMRTSLSQGDPRELLTTAAVALLDYVDENSDGFRILVRDTPLGASTATFRSIIGDVASRVEGIMVEAFRREGLDPRTAPLYTQMLIGMTVTLGQWWLDSRSPSKEVVVAHLVNLAWNGLSGLEASPRLDLPRS